ncbi:MAG: alanine racemase, partial [Dokdonella sp.]
MRRLHLESVVHHPVQLDWLESDHGAPPLRVWLKLDSGMHRLGFPLSDAAAAYARLRNCASVDGEIHLMTHFANSDVFDDPQTALQVDRFEAALDGLQGPRSLSNSAAVLGWPQARGEWIRPGGLLYGISAIEGRSGEDLGFQPAMTLSSKLIAINQVAAGQAIGYAGTYICAAATSIGVVSIGYGDGYPRSATTGTPVLVNGRRAALVGRVSMDLITVDLSEHPEARIGDPVVLWGRGLPVEEVAMHADTIGYELVCGMTRRVRFVEDES